MRPIVLTVALLLGACAPPTDLVQLSATDGQEALVRDGVPSLISTKEHVVMIRPVAKVQASGGRPRFVLAAFNRGKAPITLRTETIKANTNNTKRTAIRIFSHEELVREVEQEKNAKLVLAAVSGVAGAMSAANAGYSYTNGNVYGGGYSASYASTTYNPAVAQMAANQNAAVTANNIDNIRASGDTQLEQLQDTILKDHTLMPGEWHGGVIVLDVPEKSDVGRADYQIALALDRDVHTFTVAQTRSQQ